MQKKNSIIAVILIVVIVAVGGYIFFHKSPSTTYSNTSANKNTTSSSTAAGSKDQAAPINNAVVVTKTDSTVGEYLATPSGQALYTYGGDTNGTSNCTGSCLANWPAYQDNGSTSNLPTNFSTSKRADNGQTQYAYKGMPLYTFVGDTNGQMTGNGVSDFTVAQP